MKVYYVRNMDYTQTSGSAPPSAALLPPVPVPVPVEKGATLAVKEDNMEDPFFFCLTSKGGQESTQND